MIAAACIVAIIITPCNTADDWHSATDSDETCDSHGKCVMDSSIPSSELVKERSNTPWTAEEWKFAKIKVRVLLFAPT